MSWWSQTPLALAAIGMFFVPGAIVAWTSRVRGMALVALAPALTVSVVAVSAVVAPVVKLQWSLLPVAIATVLVAVVALAATAWLLKKESRPEPKPTNWGAVFGNAAAVLAAAFLIGRRLVGVFGRPDAFSQTFDNVFHLNAVRYIQETGSGSSYTVSSMTGGTFYPSAWHDLVALLAGIGGASIPVAVNVTNLIVGSMVWPLGCIFLAHKLLGNRVVVSVAAGILSAGFGAFPILLLDFGVLYPNFLGNALLPTALALGIQALGLAHEPSRSRRIDSLLLLAVLPGLALAHPSSVMALIALMVPPLLYVWGRGTAVVARVTPRPWARLAGMVVLLALGVAGLQVAWKAVRPPEVAAFWPPVETTGRAIGEVVTASGIGRPVAWAIMALSIAGLASLLVRRTQLWVVGMYLVMASLFVVVASSPTGPERTFFTGVWYNDPPRLASLLPVVILPLAAIGAVRVWDRCILPLTRNLPLPKKAVSAGSPKGSTQRGLWVVGFILAAVLAGGTQQANVREAAISASAAYRITPASPLVSSDEMALINRLPSEVPEDATIASNPWNGSALAYAFTGRKLLQLHLLSALPDGAEQVFTHLNAANYDPAVCPAVHRLNVSYVLDFGHREVHGGDNGFKGLDNLEASGVATLVDSQGQAKLYKLTACGQ